MSQSNLNELYRARKKEMEKLLEVKCEQVGMDDVTIWDGDEEDIDESLIDSLLNEIHLRIWEADVYDEAARMFSPEEDLSIEALKQRWVELAERLAVRFGEGDESDGTVNTGYLLQDIRVQKEPYRIELVTYVTATPVDSDHQVEASAKLKFTISLKEDQK